MEEVVGSIPISSTYESLGNTQVRPSCRTSFVAATTRGVPQSVQILCSLVALEGGLIEERPHLPNGDGDRVAQAVPVVTLDHARVDVTEQIGQLLVANSRLAQK